MFCRGEPAALMATLASARNKDQPLC